MRVVDRREAAALFVVIVVVGVDVVCRCWTCHAIVFEARWRESATAERRSDTIIGFWQFGLFDIFANEQIKKTKVS